MERPERPRCDSSRSDHNYLRVGPSPETQNTFYSLSRSEKATQGTQSSCSVFCFKSKRLQMSNPPLLLPTFCAFPVRHTARTAADSLHHPKVSVTFDTMGPWQLENIKSVSWLEAQTVVEFLMFPAESGNLIVHWCVQRQRLQLQDVFFNCCPFLTPTSLIILYFIQVSVEVWLG